MAIVGFGKIVERPWSVEGQVVSRPLIDGHAVSADHRVSDGHRGGLFLAAVDRLLQEPEQAMTADEIRTAVSHASARSRPKRTSRAPPDVDFRDQLDIDSMDFLNFVIALHASLGVDIPETDYPKLATLNGCVEYLAAQVA